MPKLGFVEAFAKHGAKLANPQWSVSAQASDGSLVVSLWEHHFHAPQDRRTKCSGRFDRWSGPGNSEFRRNVAHAFAIKQDVRVVISHTDKPAEVEAGTDASNLKNTFSIPDRWIGKVTNIAGH